MSWDSYGGVSDSWSVAVEVAPGTESDETLRVRLSYVVGHELAHLHGKQLDDLAETLGLRRRGA